MWFLKEIGRQLNIQNNPVFAKRIIQCHNFFHSYYNFHKSEQILENSNQQNGLQAKQTQISLRIGPCRQQRLWPHNVNIQADRSLGCLFMHLPILVSPQSLDTYLVLFCENTDQTIIKCRCDAGCSYHLTLNCLCRLLISFTKFFDQENGLTFYWAWSGSTLFDTLW